MKYFVQIGGVEHEVVVPEGSAAEGERLKLTVDGAELEIAYHEIDQLGQLLVQSAQHTYAASVEGEPNRIGVTLAGHFYDARIEDERERQAHAAELALHRGGGPVFSEMPGIVIELLVEIGESVEKDQPLLILEAMKMQNEITAPGPGRVEAIHVGTREAVRAGAKLLTLISESA